MIDRLNLARAIQELPAAYKRFFYLHDVIGYEHAEIARLLGCSTGPRNRTCTGHTNACTGYCKESGHRRIAIWHSVTIPSTVQ